MSSNKGNQTERTEQKVTNKDREVFSEQDTSQTAENIDSQKKQCENENDLGGPSFYPPLYIQRYTFIKDILDKFQPESVVDFGSAECKIFRHLKEVTSLQRIYMVDLDSPLLEVNKVRIRPQCFDYLQKRKNPLNVQILNGSATDFDARLSDCEGVTMVEFIEHLFKDDLKEVIKMVFECIIPKFCVMTTPNYEFNQLFPEPKKLRHYDHKFEWTRSQFQSWCNDICEQYGYTVEFYGIGDPPVDSIQFGSCSQAAVLKKIRYRQANISDGKIAKYTLIAESMYPHKDLTERSKKDILESELKYVVSFMSKCNDFYDEEETRAFIPVMRLWTFKTISSLCDVDHLGAFLLENNYTLSKNVDNEDCVVIDLYPDDDLRSWYYDDLNIEDQISSEKMIEGEITQHFDHEEETWD